MFWTLLKICSGYLGKSNEEYCTWITNPQNWGGEIELLILSHFYKKQIAAFDIESNNCFIYGEDVGFTERIMLVYDGLHYDALAISPYKGDVFKLYIFWLEL